jgi:hypothetical protein
MDAVDKALDTSKEVAKTFSNKEQGSRRQETDMLSDSWLSKNIRPLITIWVFLLLTVDVFGFQYSDTAKDTIYWVAIICVGFYFPGRTAEKWFKTKIK